MLLHALEKLAAFQRSCTDAVVGEVVLNPLRQEKGMQTVYFTSHTLHMAPYRYRKSVIHKPIKLEHLFCLLLMPEIRTLI